MPPPAFEQNLCFCLHNIFPLNLADVPLLKGGGGLGGGHTKTPVGGGCKIFRAPPSSRAGYRFAQLRDECSEAYVKRCTLNPALKNFLYVIVLKAKI